MQVQADTENEESSYFSVFTLTKLKFWKKVFYYWNNGSIIILRGIATVNLLRI